MVIVGMKVTLFDMPEDENINGKRNPLSGLIGCDLNSCCICDHGTWMRNFLILYKKQCGFFLEV